MKKILIVNNNMKVGGVQKSLYNLLWSIEGKYDITLCLFRPTGELMERLPSSIKLLTTKSLFRHLGDKQSESKNKWDYLQRSILYTLCRLFGRFVPMKLILASQRTLPEHYDCAIAFLHNGNVRSLYGGVQEFVSKKVHATKKVAFIHCDYGKSGGKDQRNDRVLREFDCIAACSDGCKRAFCAALPELAHKCCTVRNCHRAEEISALAAQEPVSYEVSRRNVLMVSRLTHEKGINRAIRAVSDGLKAGLPITLHIVGDGAKTPELKALTAELGVQQQVIFYGERGNPYRFMVGADLLLMTSYYEAAPMVIEEAQCLGLPVLTTQTTSSQEMVTDRCAGWVCDNTTEAISKTLKQVLSDADVLRQMKQRLRGQAFDNSEAIAQFTKLMEEPHEE